jgi:hypothetical protein
MPCCGGVGAADRQLDMPDSMTMTIENHCNCNRVSGPIYAAEDCMSCWAVVYRPDLIRGWQDSQAIIGPPPRKPPGLVSRVISVAASAVTHAMRGFPKASKSETARRLEVCQGCPYLATSGICSQCGCIVSIKATWKDQRCPINKW